MLKRDLRLWGPISKKAKTISTPFFNLKLAQNGEGVSKFAFVVSKKVDPRAVVRNRTKRVLRSGIEENVDKIKKGFDFLFILKKEAVGKNHLEVWKVLEKVIKDEKLSK